MPSPSLQLCDLHNGLDGHQLRSVDYDATYASIFVRLVGSNNVGTGPLVQIANISSLCT